METHVKVLAWIYLIFGVVGVLTGLLVWGVLGGIGGIVEMSGDRDAQVAAPILSWIGGFVFAFFAVVSLPSIAAGWGLLERAEWARILTIILSVLNLLAVPIGTIMGVYGLWVLLNKEATPLFAKG